MISEDTTFFEKRGPAWDSDSDSDSDLDWARDGTRLFSHFKVDKRVTPAGRRYLCILKSFGTFLCLRYRVFGFCFRSRQLSQQKGLGVCDDDDVVVPKVCVGFFVCTERVHMA